MSELQPTSEEAAETLLRTYYTSIIALRNLPPELILYICELADFISPWPDQISAITRHKPSRFQKTTFRTSEPNKIVPWFRTQPISAEAYNLIQRVEVRAYSHAPYPRRVCWRNFSLRLVSPANRKQPKVRYDDTPLSWQCFAHNPELPPDAEPQPGDPGRMILDKAHEVWEWFEPGDWLEVTVRAHYSWELASFRIDGALWIFKWWKPSATMWQMIQRRKG